MQSLNDILYLTFSTQIKNSYHIFYRSNYLTFQIQMQELDQKNTKGKKKKKKEEYQSHLFENYDVKDLLGAVSLK